MEAMVGLEVVEHLNNFDRFGPVILGEYRPKLLLITTPSTSLTFIRALIIRERPPGH
jgi:hypothetical protein